MNPEQAEQALRTYLRQRESLRLLMPAEPLDEPAIAEAAYELGRQHDALVRSVVREEALA